MAVDLGAVRIGVALCDETETLGSALTTLRAVGPRRDVRKVAELAGAHGAAEIVVGVPLRLDGSVGEQAQKALDFAERLRRSTPARVVMRDERLTSRDADERLAEAGVRRRERKQRIDRAAAVLILQEYLDERKRARAIGGAA